MGADAVAFGAAGGVGSVEGEVMDPVVKARVDALLPLEECVKLRKPRELREWVLAKCRAFSEIPELRKPVLRHEGPFKWFHEEIYPLSLYAVRRYGDRDDVLCSPRRDASRDVDAEVREPSRTIRLEITDAREPSEHLRMEYLVEHRRVSLTGGLKVEGTKRKGHRIENVLEAEDHCVSRDNHLGWIKTAAEGKAGGGRYGNTYELLIAVEDWWFDDAYDAHAVSGFVEREVLGLPLKFDAVHIVGKTERLFLTFPLSQGPKAN
jgi:hypothetical protein